MFKGALNNFNSYKQKGIAVEKINVYATKNGALYIKVEELFALKKVQVIVDKALKVKVVGYK
jgi:hypothetical protein